MVYDVNNLPALISLGRAGENAITEVVLDVSAWATLYPHANYAIVVERADGACYPVEITHSDGLITWLVTADETIKGYGKLEVRMMDGDVLAKSATTATYVSPSLDAGDTPEPTTPDWVSELLQKIQDLIEHGVTPEQIEAAVTEYLDKHPIDAVTREQCLQIVTDYVTEQGFTTLSDVDREVESYVDAHKGEWIAQVLPPYTSADNGKVLGIVNGVLAWVVSGSPIPPTPVRPEVPSGTWQLKSTTDKKYVIMGTDDDNNGNAKYFRLLRTYGFPYTMNVEAENLTRSIGSDVDTSFFTDQDAPALFPNGVDVTTLGKYLYDNNLGEVAQHGASANVLWDSSRLDGTFFDGVYDSYTSQGGTKTKDELKSAIIEQLSDSDVQNDAPYVAEARTQIEDAMGFYVNTVGLWGGSPIATVDGITINLNSIKGGTYDWQEHDYWGASTKIAEWHINSGAYDIARMNDGTTDMTTYIDRLPMGKAVEFFWHVPFNDRDNVREMMESIKARVDSGEVEVVTRYQYVQMGEYVDNPITQISITRDGVIEVGSADDKSKYTVVATYKDGTTANVSSEAIVDNSAVNIEVVDTYTVKASYRGFSASTNVSVVGGGMTYPDGLKSVAYWFVVNDTTQNKLIAMNTSGTITNLRNYELNYNSSGPIWTGTTGKVNGWASSDGGVTWTQEVTDSLQYQTVKPYTIMGSVAQKDNWVMIESSGNFEQKYFN